MHAIRMMAFEGAKKIGADIVYLLEPYVSGSVRIHPAYEISLSGGRLPKGSGRKTNTGSGQSTM